MTKTSVKPWLQYVSCTGCGIVPTQPLPTDTFLARTPIGVLCNDCYRNYYGTLAAEKALWERQYDLLMDRLPPLLKLMVERRRGS